MRIVAFMLECQSAYFKQKAGQMAESEMVKMTSFISVCRGF